jgi:hypothetical protein
MQLGLGLTTPHIFMIFLFSRVGDGTQGSLLLSYTPNPRTYVFQGEYLFARVNMSMSVTQMLMKVVLAVFSTQHPSFCTPRMHTPPRRYASWRAI